MSYEFTETVTLTAMTCGGCGITFAAPTKWYNAKVQSHGSFNCPNGCSRQFTAKTEAEKYKEQVEKEQREAASLRERAIGAERAKQRAEQALERHKKRAAAGVCPCCNRTVKQLADHMKAKHSEFMELQGVAPKKQLPEKVQ